jgi:hypothetical protein
VLWRRQAQSAEAKPAADDELSPLQNGRLLA